MSADDDVVEVVDEIVDDMDPARIVREAERLGVAIPDLMDRVYNELQARLASTS